MDAFRLHAARGDGVDADLARSEFLAQHARDRVHGALARRVDHGVGRRAGAGDGTDVDHAAAVGTEVLQRFLDRQDRTEDVGVELAMEFVFGDILERSERVDAGVVHQHVRRAEGLLRLRKEPFHVGRFRDVALDCDRLAALAGNLRDHAVRSLLAGGIVHCHCGAGSAQALRNRRADTLRGACHDSHLATQFASFAHFDTPVVTSSI